MSIAYIRETYGLAVKVGDLVRIRKGAGTWFDGEQGKLLRAHGQYLVVAGKTWRGNFHPGDVEKIPSPTKEKNTNGTH